MANTPENTVKKAIDKILKAYEFVNLPLGSFPQGFPRLYRALWWYKPQAGIYGRSGIPDYVGCLAGKMFGIEAKAGDNPLTVLQMKAFRDIQDAGGCTFVVRDSDTRELEDWLAGEVAAFKARIVMHIPR